MLERGGVVPAPLRRPVFRLLWIGWSISYAGDALQLLAQTWLIALLTHLTVFWETFYCFLIWPKLTRPICLAMAVGVHLGIAMCLGMKTFGLVMIIGNLAFVYPETVRDVVGWLSRRFARRTSEHIETAPSRRESLAVAATR